MWACAFRLLVLMTACPAIFVSRRVGICLSASLWISRMDGFQGEGLAAGVRMQVTSLQKSGQEDMFGMCMLAMSTGSLLVPSEPLHYYSDVRNPSPAR